MIWRGGIIPRKIVKTFEIEHIQVMDENGNVDAQMMPDLTEPQLKVMFHLMMLSRTFDQKLFNLQRSGKIGTYAQLRGEEASEIGSGFALQKDDWMAPSFREMGVYITRGFDRARIVQAWRGDVRANKGAPDSKDLPVAIPVGSQTLHAVGLAWAEKLKGTKNAAITYFGDGATSEGDFLEAINFAGTFKLPVVFFCQNNQWAISTPLKYQTAAETIAQKAIAAGIKGIQVDGNDVMGVYKVTREALDRARNGEGPTLIESITFRMTDHTTSDDASRYRKEEEVKTWLARDPIERLKKYFQNTGSWTDQYGEWVKQEVEKEVDDAVEKALQIPAPGPEELFDYVFSKPPAELEEQKRQLIQETKERQPKN